MSDDALPSGGERTAFTIALVADLHAAHAYLRANDPGVRGDPHRKAAEGELELLRAESVVGAAKVPQEALAVIRRYLRVWRPGHLWVTDDRVKSARHEPLPPTLNVLSSKTLVIGLPSFDTSCAVSIEQLLTSHRAALETHPNWILDIRGSAGGFDYVYAPLLDWLMPLDFISVGVEFLASRANADAHERLARQLGIEDSGLDALKRLVDSIRLARDGEYVRLDEEKSGFTVHRAVKDFRHRPTKVGVLVDSNVGSSSEEFLLTIRSSPLVRIFGQSTAGVLDYSNCRPWPLPSGDRTLWYATSRSLRLPERPIDGVGVLPDYALPPPKDEQERIAELEAVQMHLEASARDWR